jgi:hypothetical protein
MDKYLFIATVTKISHLTNSEAKNLALKARGEGKRAEIFTYEEAKAKGLFDPMQDLTKMED